jgi:hypothetical protein
MGCRNLLNQLGLSDDSFVSVARPASADALLILRSACRHCEECSDEAIQAECRKTLDCFAMLAMMARVLETRKWSRDAFCFEIRAR